MLLGEEKLCNARSVLNFQYGFNLFDFSFKLSLYGVPSSKFKIEDEFKRESQLILAYSVLISRAPERP